MALQQTVRMTWCMWVLLCSGAVGTALAINDISVSAGASPNPATQGARIVYTVTVANHGPDAVTEYDPYVVFLLTNPDLVELASTLINVSSGTAVREGGAVNWTAPQLGVGQSATMTVSVLTTATGTLNASVEVSFPGWQSGEDPNTANNQASSAVVIGAHPLLADLAVATWASASPIGSGRPFNYNVRIANSGPDVASNVVVRDFLPAGSSYYLDDGYISQGDLTATNGGVIVWSVGTLNVGGEASMVIDVTAAAGIITNVVTATNSTPDPDLPNNRAEVSVTVLPVADLGIDSRDFPGGVEAGAPFTFIRTVHNYGPDSATETIITNELPDWARCLAVTNAYGSWTQLPGRVVLELGTVPSGETRSVSLTFVGVAAGIYSNEAEVGTSCLDDNPGNNRITDVTEVWGGTQALFLPASVMTNTVRSRRGFGVLVKSNGVPAGNQRVHVVVTRGPHAGRRYSALTDPNGVASFHDYVGTRPGIDRLSATGTVGLLTFATEARVEWRYRRAVRYPPQLLGRDPGAISLAALPSAAVTETDLNLPVHEHAEVAFEVSENMVVKDVNLHLYLQHEGLDVMAATLVSPQGTTNVLFTGLSQATNGLGMGSTLPSDCSLDDDAPQALASGSEPFIGAYQTQGGALGSYTGEQAVGWWTFRLENLDWDESEGDIGVLHGLELELTPADGDADDDGMDDDWESANLLDAGNALDATGDADRDGMSNRDEFTAGTDPQSSNDVLKVTGFIHGSAAAGDVTLCWKSSSNTYYSIEWAPCVQPDSFTVVASNLPATTPLNTHTQDVVGGAQGFFRVQLEE
jgi:hypothetical protein